MLRVLLLAALLLPGCSRDDHATLSVFAASSLTEAFTALEAEYERSHPGVDVQVTFAGSQVLRLQIEQGAQADVFASADASHVDALREAGLAGPSTVFATNDLVVAVPAEAPVGVRTFEDLPRTERIVIGTPDVPAGRYAREALDKAEASLGAEFAAAVRDRVVSEESNVRLARAKVELGEADAAFVYRSDVRGLPAIRAVELPPEVAVRASYVAARVGEDPGADRFLTWLRSDTARTTLANHGFRTP